MFQTCCLCTVCRDSFCLPCPCMLLLPARLHWAFCHMFTNSAASAPPWI
jgi:hypothetical protein